MVALANILALFVELSRIYSSIAALVFNLKKKKNSSILIRICFPSDLAMESFLLQVCTCLCDGKTFASRSL